MSATPSAADADALWQPGFLQHSHSFCVLSPSPLGCSSSPRAPGWNRENPKEIHEQKCSLVKLESAESQRKGDECSISTKYFLNPCQSILGCSYSKKWNLIIAFHSCALLQSKSGPVSDLRDVTQTLSLSNYIIILPPALCFSL